MQLIAENRKPIKDPDDKTIENAIRSLLGNKDKEPRFALLDPERSEEGDSKFFLRVAGGPDTFVLEYRDGLENKEYLSEDEGLSVEKVITIFRAYRRGNKESRKPEIPWLRTIPKDELESILEEHENWQKSELYQLWPIIKDLYEPFSRAVISKGRSNLAQTNLRNCCLRGKNLQGADLRGANLQSADLLGAKLQDADLFLANLQEADLSGANLQKANLIATRLQGADLRDGFLEKTTGLNAPQVKRARNWKMAFYSDDFLKELGLPLDHNETLKKKLAELEKIEKKAATKK